MRKKGTFLFFLFLACSINIFGQITKEQLTESSNRAAFFLKRVQLPSGAIQDSANPLFNIWETILVTDALLDYFPETDTTIQRGLKWLHSNENEQRLMCHNVVCTTSYCIETSAVYLKLLSRLTSVQKLDSQLKTIAQLQEKNGSWKVGNPDVLDQLDFPSVTAFVINVFDSLHYSTQQLDLAYHYLIDEQLPDGSWGQTWEYYNCPGYALWQCMPALKKNPNGQSAWQKGKDFILSTQLDNGSWFYTDSLIKNNVSPELQTAFMLHCLVNEQDETSKLACSKGMIFLLQSQLINGSWNGGFFPIPNERYKKREYLIATALILKLMIAYQLIETHD